MRSSLNPGVTILIPTYNRLDMLKGCLDSIKASDFSSKVSVLIGDNAPSDEADEIYQAMPSNWKAIKHQNNLGALGNITCLLRACETRYAFFLTDDDKLLTTNSIIRIFEAAAAMKKSGAAYSYSPLPTYDKNLEGQAILVRKDFTSNMYVHPCEIDLIRQSATSAWALSRQMWDLNVFPWEIWNNLLDKNNGYLMVGACLFASLEHGLLYYKNPIIAHRHGNITYWEEFGSNKLSRRVKLEGDMAKAQIAILSHIPIPRNTYSRLLKAINQEMWRDLYNNNLEGLPALILNLSQNEIVNLLRIHLPVELMQGIYLSDALEVSRQSEDIYQIKNSFAKIIGNFSICPQNITF